MLALILAPLATELPEKANSVLWIRRGKDALAAGNVTGAMAFQATVPVALGLVVTSWELDRYAVVAGCVALAGGAIALWALPSGRGGFAPAARGRGCSAGSSDTWRLDEAAAPWVAPRDTPRRPQ